MLNVQSIADVLGVSVEVALAGVVTLALWSVVWKGVALWAAARGAQKGWFIAILIINTVGILEIVYLLAFRKKE